MLNYKSLLKSAFIGNKFIRQINLGSQVMCQAETIYPNYDANDRQWLALSSVAQTEYGGFRFARNGYLETKAVCEAYEFYGQDDQPPHNTNLYTFYLLNAMTGEQLFRVTFNTGPNTSGYSSIADRYFITTVYDANDNKVGSFTKTGAYGGLYPHWMYYDWSTKKYVFDGYGFTNENGSVSVSGEYVPFKLKIVNAYSGYCPKILYFATKDYQSKQGLRVYKGYKLS